MFFAGQLLPSRLTALPSRLYAATQPEYPRRGVILQVNTALLARLGLEHPPPASGLATGARLQAISTVYAGHQFGVYTSQLGDGRVHILGDALAPDGRVWEVQLKGAGATPFARGNSGRMGLAEAITEYLGCEAMAGLGIASTRGLALIAEDKGHEAGLADDCILARVAPSHLRFGHFEYLHNQQERSLLEQLADHVIAEYYPELLQVEKTSRYLTFLYAVTQRTACLLARWQAVGFVHAVMNTDNMSILGLTLDYGVYGFMEAYDPGYSANPGDDQQRYAFDQQVDVACWNCLALAEALIELLPGRRIPAALLRRYRATYLTAWQGLMRHKLGLSTAQPGDSDLITALLNLLQRQRVDYTRFFRQLSYVGRHGEAIMADTISGWNSAFRSWFAGYQQRLATEQVDAMAREVGMLAHNPRYILRQPLLQEAIRRVAQRQDDTLLQDLLRVLQSPFAEHNNYDYLA